MLCVCRWGLCVWGCVCWWGPEGTNARPEGTKQGYPGSAARFHEGTNEEPEDGGGTVGGPPDK